MNFITAGRSLLILGGDEGTHLWFVLSDPDRKTGKVVVAMLVSKRPHTDKTVALVPGDHPFIDHESNIDYGGATLTPASKLTAAISRGDAHLHEDLSPAVLLNIQCGLLSSSRTCNYMVDHCRPLFGKVCDED